ncbi:3-deoxy-D-manno-octulosonic acid transferase [Desulfovibrio sp. OttesenSCG-928-G11]|nr:3-deoxy-D-manno-octulosonic acid transferase [Desulfovibrio sp. OttesenSCG-928-G11]
MTAISSLFFPLYSGLWRAAQPWLRRHKRLADGFSQRLVPDDWPGMAKRRAGRPRIWLQAASGGEARLLQALIPALEQKLGQSDLLCTSCTRQGLDILASIRPAQDSSLRSAFFPLDRPDLMEKAVAQADPDVLVLLETELWPSLLRTARSRKLPVLAVNGRLTPKSRRAYGLAAPLWRALAPDRVLAVSEEDAARFASLFGASCAVSVMPNIKFDLAGAFAGAAPDKDCAALRKALGLGSDALVLLFASVREQEEDLLLPVLAELHGTAIAGRPLRLVLAPRHMQRLEAWRDKLAGLGINSSPRSIAGREGSRQEGSDREGSGQEGRALILHNRFGEMPDLYALADAAFVGGSLAPLGGQNFLEALALGVSPFVGPHVQNFAWAGEDLFSLGLARRVPDSQALLEALKRELPLLAAGAYSEQSAAAARRRRQKDIQEAFRLFLAPRLGGADLAAGVIAASLKK